MNYAKKEIYLSTRVKAYGSVIMVWGSITINDVAELVF